MAVENGGSNPVTGLSSTPESTVPLHVSITTTAGVTGVSTGLSTKNTILTSLTAGALAGALAKTVIAPLERTKIIFQTSDRVFNYRKVVQQLIFMFRTEGLISLWRGNSATMIRIAPSAAIQFAAHEQAKRFLMGSNGRESRSNYKQFLAGSIAGVISSSITFPLDVARARMAVTAKKTFKHIGEVFLQIIREEGILKMYRGISASLLGVIPYGGFSFFTYETLKRWRADQTNSPLQAHERLVCGACAGLVGQTSSYPLDIARRRMQTCGVLGQPFRGLVGTIIYVAKNEGIRKGLYKGLTMNWLKGPIAVGVSFTTYDTVVQGLRTLPIYNQ